jgi:gluconokinase
MNAPHYVLGTDIGTTGTKTVLFDRAGTVIGKALSEYPLHSPTPDTAEQDPDEIFQAVLRTIQQVMQTSGVAPGEVICLSFSAAMHSLIGVDAAGKPLTRSITWADNRSAAWAEKIKQGFEGQAIYRRTGTPIHPMSPFVKLVWLKQEQPDLFQQVVRWISIKEYVIHQLFQQYVIDYSIASATGLLNLEQLNWDDQALAIAGIQPDRLSTLVPTTHILRSMSSDFASFMGLDPDTPVVIGASDGVLSNLGVGAIKPGIVATTIGTSGAIRAVVDRPITDPQARLFCYALTETQWVVGGAVNNGGIALRWVRDQLADAEVTTAKRLGVDPYELLMQMAATVPPGSEGLIFHPYLLGERSPLWDAQARGSFLGLTLNHTKAHLVRSVLEGVLFNLRIVLQALQDFTQPAQRIQATGGFARSMLWRQIMADIFNQEITIPAQHESSCLGAAILGLYAMQAIDSLETVTQMIGETHRHQPIAENAATYETIFPVYVHLLERIRLEYGPIAHLQHQLAEKHGSVDKSQD